MFVHKHGGQMLIRSVFFNCSFPPFYIWMCVYVCHRMPVRTEDSFQKSFSPAVGSGAQTQVLRLCIKCFYLCTQLPLYFMFWGEDLSLNLELVPGVLLALVPLMLELQVCTAFSCELCGTEGWFSCLLNRHFSVEAKFCRRVFGVTLPKNWVGEY